MGKRANLITRLPALPSAGKLKVGANAGNNSERFAGVLIIQLELSDYHLIDTN